MTEFNLNKYATLLELYAQPSLEDEENYVPYLFGTKERYPDIKKWCDNLDNIIENE